MECNNESLILANESLILVNESFLLANDSLILANESFLLVDAHHNSPAFPGASQMCKFTYLDLGGQ
ncbi:Cystathionine beta-lyase [Nostoc flagelliforme CCNUN1]|uniref:Cystathionine beta-lyase n=1 Tax=Nostoc flagelliforme CCNUN1 TaxID=2038116 RepID=A0A2K8SI37_9NOSO|nr:Cystathionine beta-lyase [Nostoc flagelliforme CCNUN1]